MRNYKYERIIMSDTNTWPDHFTNGGTGVTKLSGTDVEEIAASIEAFGDPRIYLNGKELHTSRNPADLSDFWAAHRVRLANASDQVSGGSASFNVCFAGEIGAGLRSFTDEVTVSCKSGQWGGEPGEFEEYMRDCLKEWYDGAKVTRIAQAHGTTGGVHINYRKPFMKQSRNAESWSHGHALH